MAAARNLLVELLVEELPPKALKKLGEAFAAGLRSHLQANDYLEEASAATAFATPRRLAVHVSGVLETSRPRPRPPTKLLPVSVGLKEGQPTEPLKKRLFQMYHPEVDLHAIMAQRVFVEGEGAKAMLMHREDASAGVPLMSGLQSALDHAVRTLPIPKVMQYQLHRGQWPGFQPGWTSVHFVRPAHGLVALHGSEPVDQVTVLGLSAGRQTRGHRFEAMADPIVLRDADSYVDQLRDEGAVIASFAERRGEIARQLAEAAAKLGLRPIDDDALLDEVTALVERPNVLTCEFERQFLEVPQECLILTMKANQKYFPLLDAQGRLTNRFLVVSNIRPADPRRVIEGNERVVRPRLADARFFFDQDRKRSLESRVPQLDRVVYHGKLGSQGERMRRVCTLARRIGEATGGAPLGAAADRAAMLAKADLLTDMVGEFPELQGVMGGYYARHDGETEEVAQAIEDHYRPRFAGDELPRGACGVALALADKLETLAGLFGIGQLPSGDKDPFALRRHALGVIRMLIERALPLETDELIAWAFAAFGPAHGQAQAEVALFLRERLVGYLREQGHSAQEVEAVLEVRELRWAELPARLAALRRFAELPEAPALAAANKRVGNILRKSGAAPGAGGVQTGLLRDAAESALHAALRDVSVRADAAYAAGDLVASLQSLAALRRPVDDFFDQVMVNTDDPALRANRLALLADLHAAMNRVADLSRLAA